jgi:hypothetical protein
MVLGAPALAEGSMEGRGRAVRWRPHHRFEIQSALSPSAAIAALKPLVEPRRMFRIVLPNAANERRFQGDVGADSFEISRIIGYRNSFLPLVSGRLHGAGSRSTISVEMKIHPLALVLMIVIAAAMLLVAGTLAFAGEALALIPVLVMPTLFYGIVLWAFWFEADKQERTLREIFNGT